MIVTCQLRPDEIQKKVFFWMEGDPCQQPTQLNHTQMKPCIYHKNFDYFQVSAGIFAGFFIYKKCYMFPSVNHGIYTYMNYNI